MKLRGYRHLTPSGKSKRRGKMDSYWLEPETEDEERKLREIRETGKRLTRIDGTMLMKFDKELRDLENLGKSINLKLKKEIQIIRC
jgi:hypothetical protein